jgi:hypothetical protein
VHAGICAGGGPSLIGQLASRVEGRPYRNHYLLSQSTSRAWSHCFAYAQPLICAFERAVSRGEIAPDTDLAMAADLVVGPIAVCLFFKGGRLNPKIVDPMVDLAFAGIRAK